MWFVKEILSVFTWLLVVFGSICMALYLYGVDVCPKVSFAMLIGAFLLCSSYFMVKKADKE